ncbi:adhesion G protein-coupled receptor F5 [Carassius gibelio]|uniref:adhesion G protein-coupled receptor F5 n=1 Tax=Carassius gibelio TaxID=101364 RepID=UPI002279B35C|nr:adhesion G protein-coupled receptor F5 [Carassius gibelio]
MEQKQLDIRDATVTDIKNTTDCTLNETHKNCSCMPGHNWSEDMCQKYGCCNNSCTLKLNDIALLAQFSTLKYFDSLIINGYRSGSVIVDYTVQIMSSVTIPELDKLARTLENTTLNSTLVTTGLITINGPQKAIDIGSSADITCTPPDILGEVKWFLTDVKNKTTEITEGKEAALTKAASTKTNLPETNIVKLKDISGSWKGTLKCVYQKGFIKHTASTKLDIALLPEIQAMSNPQFPDCRDANNQFDVVIECKILNDGENYSVTWDSNFTNPQKELQSNGNYLSYKLKGTILCVKKKEAETVTCTFTNTKAEKNRIRSQTVEIPIINANSKFCEGEGVWPITKNDYTAQLSCTYNAVGLTSRNCSNQKWGTEISSCVITDLHDVQLAVEILDKGIGFIKDDADRLFRQIQLSTIKETFNSFSNINTSVDIFQAMNSVSKQQSNQWNDTIMPDFVSSISNTLNDTRAWENPETKNTNLSVTFLQTIEEMMHNSNLKSNNSLIYQNVKLVLCSKAKGEHCGGFNSTVSTDDSAVVIGYQNIHEILPEYIGRPLVTNILSVIVNNTNNNHSNRVEMKFDYAEKRERNHEIHCVFWDVNNTMWSSEGCEWGGASNQKLCTCEHNSAFTIMMSQDAETLPYMEELTYAGLGISIVSLVLCLIIEFLVWDTVVKSHISHFRHVALVNISFCLLLAHCGFLASANLKEIPQNWCSFLTVFKHFFFLAVFFWMLCLSFVLLHQLIFVFEQLRKKVFFVLSITVGYVCPLICVATTFITFENGKENEYYSKETCWLIYRGVLKGSIFSFVIPAITIVIVNFFTLVVVILKIVNPTLSESKARDQKDVARSMIKTIVFLSPVLGITWLLGILVLYLDLTQKPYAQIVGYTFTLLNSLQGFLILLTNCLGEKKVCDALMKRFKSKVSMHERNVCFYRCKMHHEHKYMK